MDEFSLTPDVAPADPAAAGPAPPGVFAFATDPDTEEALREGLAEVPDRQVWPGDLRTAMAAVALAGDPPPGLIFVDLDGTPYPAGAIHELASVCEVGTIVVALGSDGTARFSREILLAGVSDYFIKPISAREVREAAGRAAGAGADAAGGGAEPGTAAARGRVAGFLGAGGSGATTLAAAAALLAAERGAYVSVLDLNRTLATLAFALDVEPAAGLDQLLDAARTAAPNPEMVDGVRAERSDRIAVYGYRPAPILPPSPSEPAVRRLLAALARRSHLVVVDGLSDASARAALLAEADAPVLVCEPTRTGARRAVRTAGRIGRRPAILVQNHTRAFKRRAGARGLRDAGVEAAPDVAVPFDPSLPRIADRGWPGGRLPSRLAKPVGALVDRILTPADEAGRAVGEAGTAAAPAAPEPASRARGQAPASGPRRWAVPFLGGRRRVLRTRA